MTDEELQKEIERHKAAQQRQEMWEALERDGAMPADEVLGQLSNLLSEDIERMHAIWGELSLDVRRRLAHALSELAEADFTMDFSAVFRIALHDEDADIRCTAVTGLRELEDVRLVPTLVELLRGDPATEVRAAAADALSQYVLLGELQKIRRGPFEQAVMALCESYRDPAEKLEVQRRAIAALGYTGEYEVPNLIATAYTHADERMRASALQAMGRSADTQWREIIRRELDNPSPIVRLEATRACGELQLREATADIINLTEDVNTHIRAAALWALGQIGGNQARRVLEQFITNEDETLRAVADAALAELNFFHGDLNSFFGPPEEFDGEAEDVWHVMTWTQPDDLMDSADIDWPENTDQTDENA